MRSYAGSFWALVLLGSGSGQFHDTLDWEHMWPMPCIAVVTMSMCMSWLWELAPIPVRH